MDRGNRIYYDDSGMIFMQTGDCEGAISPLPVLEGVRYIDVHYGM